MVKEIKRNYWSKFCRKFSSDNKYRHMNINFSGKGEPDARVSGDYPFMGLTLEKRGRLIDGIRLHAGWPDPDKIIDTATFSKPHQYPEGIPYVIVNGELAVDEGRWTESLSGMILYGAGKKAR